METAEDELLCTICSELFIHAVTLSCSHTFCQKCIDRWRQTKNACPICRAKITSRTRTHVLDSYIDKLVDTRSEDYKSRRMVTIAEREQEPAQSTSTRRVDVELQLDDYEDAVSEVSSEYISSGEATFDDVSSISESDEFSFSSIDDDDDDDEAADYDEVSSESDGCPRRSKLRRMDP